MDCRLSKYTSCIKINGKPILPPLVNDKYRKQIEIWRGEAIRRELQKQNISNRNVSRPRSKSVPFSKHFDVGLPNAMDLPGASFQDLLFPASAAETVQTNAHENLKDSNDALFTPRLIRSNSYTLDAPSPALLLFLKSQPDFYLNISNEESTTSTDDNLWIKGDVLIKKPKNLQLVTTIQCNILPEEQSPILKNFDEKSLMNVEKSSTPLEKLLDRQKEEQQLLMDSFSKLKSVLIDQIENQSVDVFSEENSPRLESSTPITADQSSQSLYYTFENSETDTIPNRLHELLIDFDDNYVVNDSNNEKPMHYNYIEEMETLYLSPASRKMSKNDSPDTLKFSETKSNTSNISRQLFQENNLELHGPAEQAWAASKICAAVKGYLTRRLLRTERVQILIQTIQESLLCAMELHRECSDNIEAADVELHRRLMQQVSAACYAFHEVFFELTIPEQMSVIALDREHLKEKLLRRKKSDRSI